MLRALRPPSPLAAPLRVLGIVFCAGALVVAGYLLGNPGAVTSNSNASIDVVNTGGDQPGWVTRELDFGTFWDVWEHIRTNYVDQPVAEGDLYYGALQGLLASLDDPYSMYFTPSEAEEFSQELAGSFFGIGAEIGMKDERIVVIAPLAGTPAERSGMLAGDAIIAIDDVSTIDMTVSEAVDRIRGPRDTEVVLTLSRDSAAEAFDVAIMRDEITVQSVKAELRDDGIGVVTVSLFNDDTSAIFEDVAQDMVSRGATGIIVDVRNNPGGLLDAAIAMAGFWVDGQTVVIEEIRGERDEYQADGIAYFADVPTVVLVNGGSASASEILAGALQDYDVGKGSVQEYYELPDGSAIKMTIARWLTPLGRSIDDIGITPDVIVSYTEEDYHAGNDPQFDAAVDFLASP